MLTILRPWQMEAHEAIEEDRGQMEAAVGKLQGLLETVNSLDEAEAKIDQMASSGADLLRLQAGRLCGHHRPIQNLACCRPA